jgi:GTP-binding protein Era
MLGVDPFEQPEDARIVRVAIVGLANAGKSTLLNTLIGHSLAAVSDRPHTTRRRILGALTRGSVQAVFVDTPGLVVREEESKRPLELVRTPWEALEECDVAVLLVDASSPEEWRLTELAYRMKEYPNVIAVLNKIDAVSEGAELLRALDRVRELGLGKGDEPLLVSALKGTHMQDLRDELLARAKPGDWEFASGQTCEASTQWRVHEAIRQAIFQILRMVRRYLLFFLFCIVLLGKCDSEIL